MEFQSLVSNKIKSYLSECIYTHTYDKFIYIVQNRHACMNVGQPMELFLLILFRLLGNSQGNVC